MSLLYVSAVPDAGWTPAGRKSPPTPGCGQGLVGGQHPGWSNLRRFLAILSNSCARSSQNIVHRPDGARSPGQRRVEGPGLSGTPAARRGGAGLPWASVRNLRPRPVLSASGTSMKGPVLWGSWRDAGPQPASVSCVPQARPGTRGGRGVCSCCCSDPENRREQLSCP